MCCGNILGEAFLVVHGATSRNMCVQIYPSNPRLLRQQNSLRRDDSIDEKKDGDS